MPERRIALIVNPVAGGGRGARYISAAVTSILGLLVYVSARPGHARHLAVEAIGAGANFLIAIGGDGTFHEVADGIAAAEADVTMGLMPAGTGVDTIRSLGLSLRYQLPHLLVSSGTTTIDLLQVEIESDDGARRMEFCLNAADAGLGAEVAHRVNRNQSFYGGSSAFLLAALRSIVAHRPSEFSVKLDGSPLTNGRTSMVVAANGAYFGGGMHVAPGTQLDDGEMDVVILKATPRAVLAANLLPRVYRGTHLRHRNVHHRRGRRLEISSPAEFPIELDGEVRAATRVTIGIRPGPYESPFQTSRGRTPRP